MNDLIFNSPKSGTVLCFGELLARFGLEPKGKTWRKNLSRLFVGGAELNVATALAVWGLPSRYYTALPDNFLTNELIDYLKEIGISITDIYRHGVRMGLYYLTEGTDFKNDSIIYDRRGSAFSELKPGMIDWEEVLLGVGWFHMSAISPALNQNVVDVCLEALRIASAKGITTSIDLNYRSKLWDYGKKASSVMPEIVQHCDVVMGNIWASEIMLGIPVDTHIHKKPSKKKYLDEAARTSESISCQYPKSQIIANTFRFDTDNRINYYAALYTDGQHYSSDDFTSSQIISKVGSGDCFMAGLIYGFYNSHTPQETLHFATQAAFDKLFVANDSTTRSIQEIMNTQKRR